MEPLVSIVVPIYDVEAYLDECVQSLLHQTYQNLEIILVDDGSPDRCPEMCEQYAKEDSRVKVIHKKNGGLSDARNVGMDLASGEYLMFVDSDDWIHLETVEKLFKAAKKYDAQVSVSCIYQENGGQNGEVYTGYGIETILTMFERPIFGCGGHYVWGKLYEMKCLEGMRFPVGKKYEDVGFTPYLYFKNPKVVILNEGLYHYRIREGSIMQASKGNTSLDLIELMDGLVQYSRNNHFHEKKIFAYVVRHFYWRYWDARKNGVGVENEFLVGLRAYLKKNFWQMQFNRGVPMNARVRLTELVLFNCMII